MLAVGDCATDSFDLDDRYHHTRIIGAAVFHLSFVDEMWPVLPHLKQIVEFETDFELERFD